MTNSSCDPMIKRVVEAILFISERPVAIANLKEVMDTVSTADIRQAVEELMQEYENHQRGMIITEIAGGYQMLSSPQLAAYVRNFFKRHVKEKLSRPALETLAIIAYKQPVTRGEIELIRGVNSDGVVGLLLNKDLVKTVGRKDIPGRPYLFGTTKLFLEYFGLKSLDDLPRLESFTSLVERQEESVALHPDQPIPDRQEVTQTDPALVRPAGDESYLPDSSASTDGQQNDTAVTQPQTNVGDQPDAVTPGGQPVSHTDRQIRPSDEKGDTKIEDADELKEAMDGLNRADQPSESGRHTDVPSASGDA